MADDRHYTFGGENFGTSSVQNHEIKNFSRLGSGTPNVECQHVQIVETNNSNDTFPRSWYHPTFKSNRTIDKETYSSLTNQSFGEDQSKSFAGLF